MLRDKLIDLIYPPRCALCDDVLKTGRKYVCEACEKKAVYIREPYCLKCGKALSSGEEYCEDCREREHVFIQGRAVFDYGSISDSLFRFKNKGRVEYAKFYADAIWREKGDYIRLISPEVFVPVPIYRARMRERGYNQAEEISKALSALSGIPTDTTLVERVRRTAPLKNLNPSERQNNLKNAFKVGINDVKLKTIMIIDDIYTTGSTIDEIARTILGSFPCDIYFLTVTIGRGV